ncbi:MAG: Npt1/Npt2 family nucleotide transporter [Pseudomonadota bacterium]
MSSMPVLRGHSYFMGNRAVILFLNFFLIILAYYQVKSASRSLLIEYWGADHLPYVWVVSALVLGSFIGIYHRIVERFSRLAVVLSTSLLFIILMLGFRLALSTIPETAILGFYVFVDIFSVILVEQFWSLANATNRRGDGRRTYWFISSGGLVGGIAGGATAAALLKYTPMTTPDLLLSSAVIMMVILGFNFLMGRLGLYLETPAEQQTLVAKGGWRSLVGNRYLLLIATALFCAQLAQPLVEYQLFKTIEASYPILDERTQYISFLFSILGFFSLGVNLLLTPIIHRYLGIVAGMLIQPLMLSLFATGFMAYPTLWMASAMKICDRGLSYSINRASKEQLYIPIDPVHTYQAKAWIDMLGYRMFKVVGSMMLLIFTQWPPVALSLGNLSWVTLIVCIFWIGVLSALAREYRSSFDSEVLVHQQSHSY